MALRQQLEVCSIKEQSYARDVQSPATGAWCRPFRQTRRDEKSELKGASKEMAESMMEKELDDLASTKRKGLPERKDE